MLRKEVSAQLVMSPNGQEKSDYCFMAKESNEITKFKKLTKENYSTWRSYMSMGLEKLGLWDVVEMEKPLKDFPEGLDSTSWDKKNREAYLEIGLCIGETMMDHLEGVKTGFDAWKKLQNYFEANTIQNEITMKRKFYRLEMVTEDMDEHLQEAKKMYDTMIRMGLEIKEIDLCAVVLNSLPEEYDNLIVAWDVSGSKLDFATLRSKIINIWKDRKERLGSNAFFAKKNVKPQQGTQLKCFKCGKVGHLKRDCKTIKKKPAGYGFFAGETQCETVEWCLDSGASRHMSGDRSIFETYQNLNGKDKVLIASGVGLPIIGKGTVIVGTKKGIQVTVEVVHVKGLENNLFSISKFTQTGGAAIFQNGECILQTKNQEIFVQSKCTNGIFVFTTEHSHKALAAIMDVSVDINVLHKAYGHINHQSLRHMVAEGSVFGISKVTGQDHQCHACVTGKLTTKSYQRMKERNRATIPLERVSLDVYGPTRIASINGEWYKCSISDEATDSEWKL